MAASVVASSETKQAGIAKKIGSSIAEKVPLQLRENGIEAKAACVYVKGPFAIVQVDVLHADVKELLEKKLDAEKVQKGDQTQAFTRNLILNIGHRNDFRVSAGGIDRLQGDLRKP